MFKSTRNAISYSDDIVPACAPDLEAASCGSGSSLVVSDVTVSFAIIL